MERYKLEKRTGIWAIYDTEHPDYCEQPGCNADFPWVVAYWDGVCGDGDDGWVIPDFRKSQAEKLLSLLNGKEEQPKLHGRNLEFGDEIEFKMKDGGSWHGGLYCGVNDRGKRIARSAENDFVHVVSSWRWPIKWRMERGQPLIVNGGYLRTFASIDKDYMYVFADDLQGEEKVNTWRLPTKRELQDIGHDGLGWLTEDE